MSLGFVFPGQGAQQVGMAADFAESHATVRELLAEANDALGFDLAAVVKRSRAVSKRLNGGVGHLLKKNKVPVFDGRGRLGKRDDGNSGPSRGAPCCASWGISSSG